MMLSDRRLKTLHDLMNFRIALKIKVDEQEKLMKLVLIIQRNCNHLRVEIANLRVEIANLRVEIANLIHLIMIFTICLAKKILTMNSLTKMNLCMV